MIQLQQNHPVVRQEFCRTLAPLSPIQENARRLRDLAEVCIHEPADCSPATSPTAAVLKDYNPSGSVTGAREPRGCGVPSIQTLFAIADREDGYTHPGMQSGPRRPSCSSEYSWHGSSSNSAPELSPHLSTAQTTPIMTPVTPGFPADWNGMLPAPPQSTTKMDALLAGERKTIDEQNRQRRLELARGVARPRRPSSRQAPYAPDNRGRRHSGTRSNSVSKYQAAAGICGGVGGEGGCGAPAGLEDGDRDRKPHFNQPYTRSVKLFILYYKDDCKYGWPAINARRVELLPVLLGGSYKREVEDNRKVAGINGFYYRLNAMMPALTPDGSGLQFMERDGRFWEFTESSKCRTTTTTTANAPASPAAAAPAAAAAEDVRAGTLESTKMTSSAGPTTTTTTTTTRTDARPRGMVDRYPEEVVHYWDDYVRHFVPPEKHAEVYNRAKRYCEIRAEQRRAKGVPQWTPDNEAERVIHKNPPDGKSKAAAAAASRKGSGSSEENVLREMMSACVLNQQSQNRQNQQIPPTR
ncbi:hypothetical protein VPNG_07467 [Cytospora leucostoma]|uniref:Uncharacterized protein n=1 Tax=Cytospora leucostoma TaxID=1230097 RepID=A0A423WMY3_9PEZI|nr:hypothetical protein VPNG_07467 [Cytospora leucostoma]